MSIPVRQFRIPPARFISGCRRKRCSAHLSGVAHSSGKSLHTEYERRELPYPVENGVGNFLPPEALKTVVEWQDGLLVRLSEQVRGTELAQPRILDVVIKSAGVQKYVQAYNYACLAMNNSFFLDNLKPPAPGSESNEAEMSQDLKSSLRTHLTDMDVLRERFIASASGMVSSGWLWLVTDGRGRVAVIPTFGSGTLLVRSAKSWGHLGQEQLLRQPFDWPSEPLGGDNDVFSLTQGGPTPTSPISGAKATQPPINPHTPYRTIRSSAIANNDSLHKSVRDYEYHQTSATSDIRRKAAHTSGSRLYPLCCLSLYEHTWLSAGLGVWGKEEYVRRFFSVINWKKVSETFTKFQGQGSQELK